MSQTQPNPQDGASALNPKNDVINAIPDQLRDGHDVKLVQDLDTGRVAVHIQVANTDVVPIRFQIVPVKKNFDETVLYEVRKRIGRSPEAETISDTARPIRPALLTVNNRVQQFETY